MAHAVGRGACVWMAMVLSAAMEYILGVSDAMQGEQRGSAAVGAAVGAAVVRWAMATIVGVTLGGMLLCVCH